MLARSILLPASIAAALAAPAATAPLETATVPVSYADLDLASPDGAVALKRRIKAAADAICGRPDARDPKLVQLAAKCRKDAIAKASLEANEAVAAAQTKERYAALPRPAVR